MKKFIEIVPWVSRFNTPIREKEDYMFLPINAMEDLGYQSEYLCCEPKKEMIISKVFQNNKINYKSNIFSYLLFLKRQKNVVVFANSRILKSFLVGFFGFKKIFMSHQSALPAVKWKQLVFKFFLKKFDKIRVVNDYEKNELIKLGIKSNKINVIPLSIDYDFFSQKVSNNVKENIRKKYAIKKNDRCLLGLANIRRVKNPLTLLKAFKILSDKRDDLKLIFIGKDKMSEQNLPSVIEMSKRIGLDLNKLVFTGPLESEDIVKVMSVCEIGINTSFHEGQCLAVYEMASANLALCLSAIGSFTSVFTNSALFHNISDHNKLAQDIDKYLSDNDLIEKHRKLNHFLVKNRCDYDVIKKQFQEAFGNM